MIMDFNQEGDLKIDMQYYIKETLEELTYEIKETHKTPWAENLLKIQEDAKKLNGERRRIFQTYVMKEMFLCKIARNNIEQ